MLWTHAAHGLRPALHGAATGSRPRRRCSSTRNDEALPHDDVLLNLRAIGPPFFGRFQRLIEIVSRDDDRPARARERFRFYRDRGYQIHDAPRSARADAG